MTIKVTFFFSQERKAWSETHYDLPATTLLEANADARQFANGRSKLLGNGATLTGYRCSLVPANRQVFEPTLVPLGGSWPVDTSGVFYESQFANLSVLFRLQGQTGGSAPILAPAKLWYMAGMPRTFFQVGTPTQDDINYNANCVAAVDSFMGTGALGLANQTQTPPSPPQAIWGYRFRTQTGITQSTGLTVSATSPAQIGVGVGAAIPGVTVGSQVVLSKWRRTSTRQPGLSGVFTVANIVNGGAFAPVVYYLWDTAGQSPSNFAKPGFIALAGVNYAAYQTYGIEKVVSHKRGGRIGLSRGRLPIR